MTHPYPNKDASTLKTKGTEMFDSLKDYFNKLETSFKWLLGFSLVILFAPNLAVIASLIVFAYLGYDLYQHFKTD